MVEIRLLKKSIKSLKADRQLSSKNWGKEVSGSDRIERYLSMYRQKKAAGFLDLLNTVRRRHNLIEVSEKQGSFLKLPFLDARLKAFKLLSVHLKTVNKKDFPSNFIIIPCFLIK